MIYVLQEGYQGDFKISQSRNPRKRAAGLQTGNSKRLTLVAEIDGDYQTESLIHKFLLPFQHGDGGTEWFARTPETITFVQFCQQFGHHVNDIT